MKLAWTIIALVVLSLSHSGAKEGGQKNLEKELNRLNRRLTDAYEREDVDLLRQLLSDRHVHNNVFGHRMSKEEFLADIESGTLIFESYKTPEIEWFITDETAVATGVIEARAVRAGKPVPATRFRFTRIYTREQGSWRVLLFHNTMLPKKKSTEEG